MITFGTAPSSAPTYTFANLPAAGVASRVAFVSNAGTKGSFWYDDGTRWKPLNGIATLATLDATTASIANSETIVLQTLIPAGLLKPGDRIRVYGTATKSGTTDAATIRWRLGTAGTTADTQIFTSGIMSTAQRYWAGIYENRLESNTSTQQLVTGTFYGYSGASATALLAPVTISSAAANNLYFSVSILSTGATDTVQMVDCQIEILSSAN